MIPAYPVTIVDPTGAGDAFCGGVLAGYRNTYDPLQAAMYGNISSAMIMEGIDRRTLQRAVGHFPGTELPGQEGNFVIAGHRDTFFRPLRNIRINDEIKLTTLHGSYRYRVDSIKVTPPEDLSALDNSEDDSIMTLVTCFPFEFVGNAPQRFVVRAHRISETATPASPEK